MLVVAVELPLTVRPNGLIRYVARDEVLADGRVVNKGDTVLHALLFFELVYVLGQCEWWYGLERAAVNEAGLLSKADTG